MKTYLAQRLGIAALTLFGMSVVIFVLLRLAPGDIVDILFSTGGYAFDNLLERTPHAAAAEAFLRFLTSPPVQARFKQQGYEVPVR